MFCESLMHTRKFMGQEVVLPKQVDYSGNQWNTLHHLKPKKDVNS